MAKKLISRQFSKGRIMDCVDSSKDFLALQLGQREHEAFCIIFLDTRHKVVAFEEMFRGTIDGASVYPREVVKEALSVNASAVILAHNHPSGVAEPNQSDIKMTQQLKDVLAVVDVRVLDHIIVGGATTVSMAELGLI
jgi:DNA repair protein RadC